MTDIKTAVCSQCKKEFQETELVAFQPFDLNCFRVNPEPLGYCPECESLTVSDLPLVGFRPLCFEKIEL